jgi:hypothetical protein
MHTASFVIHIQSVPLATKPDFFNNFTTNEDIATKFEADLPHCVRNVTMTNVLLFKFRCNIFIGVRIIKEKSGSVASGTPCSFLTLSARRGPNTRMTSQGVIARRLRAPIAAYDSLLHNQMAEWMEKRFKL